MAYTAKVVLDSVNPAGHRLATVECDYWRAIHAEFLTHRTLSRNSSGSRAIPVEKVLARVESDPALPVFWAKNQKGMQAVEELSGRALDLVKATWLGARDGAVGAARYMAELGLHKALANRIVEPWAHIQTVFTTTMPGLMNFLMLRCHPDAQQECRALAEAVLAAVAGSKPEMVGWGGWHLPYLTAEERRTAIASRQVRWSIARVARVSYANHGTGKVDHAADEALHDLLQSRGHMSPFEQVAEAVEPHRVPAGGEGNFGPGCGWQQYRKLLPGEAIFEGNPRREEIRRALYEW